MAQGSVQLSKHSSNKTKELRVEASSAGKQGPLEGKPKKMISALTSWEGKGWDGECISSTMIRNQFENSKRKGAKKIREWNKARVTFTHPDL